MATSVFGSQVPRADAPIHERHVIRRMKGRMLRPSAEGDSPLPSPDAQKLSPKPTIVTTMYFDVPRSTSPQPIDQDLSKNLSADSADNSGLKRPGLLRTRAVTMPTSLSAAIKRRSWKISPKPPGPAPCPPECGM